MVVKEIIDFYNPVKAMAYKVQVFRVVINPILIKHLHHKLQLK